ncbi:binding domain of DNA repair protein ercc1 (rad10/Swi10) domain-containing protein [Ditylenchus destructor]|uniref:Binding domain of DNA repair protein ercc1 (Rad10/Swi10) domain-containing protein n=1 Tax=Ditylenchus destructor TaxID=166010 RepID=A0AAD4MUI0_9BILA|nr:binding domain of DNA repair protein ercc1 (rad10/Swi10) domain-containing protein [Ditylenchus destructor]
MSLKIRKIAVLGKSPAISLEPRKMDNPMPSTSSGSSSAASSSSKVIVNRKRQDGNPVIKYIRNVPYEWSTDLKTDFECSQNCGVLYLSLKYHKLHPGYIETRFGDGKQYQMKYSQL